MYFCSPKAEWLSRYRRRLTPAGTGGSGRMAEIRFCAAGFLRGTAQPLSGGFVSQQFVCDSYCLGKCGGGTFATLTLVVLDIASARHDHPLRGGEAPPRCCCADGTVEIDANRLGAGLCSGDRRFAAAALQLGAGDTVLLASDGLTEAGAAQGQNRGLPAAHFWTGRTGATGCTGASE